MKRLAKGLPILVGLLLGVLLMAAPVWLRPLGGWAYVVTGTSVLVLLVAFVALLIAANLPADISLEPIDPALVPRELDLLAARYRGLGFGSAGPPTRVGFSQPGVMLPFVNESERTYGSVFRTGTLPAKTAFDFFSPITAEGGGLTSSAEVGGAILRSGPGDLRQVLPGSGIEAVFAAHKQALAWLASQGLPARPVSQAGFVTDFKTALVYQRRCFLAQPLLAATVAIWRAATRRTPHLGPLPGQRLGRRQVARLKRPG